MSEKDPEIKRRILEFLRRRKLCVVATVSPDGLPDAASVYYIVRNGFEMDFITEKNTEKYKNLQANDAVTVVVVDAKTREIAKIKGRASLVEDAAAAISAVKDFTDKMNEKEINQFKLLPILERHNGDLAVVRINPVSIRMTVYGEKEMDENMIIF